MDCKSTVIEEFTACGDKVVSAAIVTDRGEVEYTFTGATDEDPGRGESVGRVPRSARP